MSELPRSPGSIIANQLKNVYSQSTSLRTDVRFAPVKRERAEPNAEVSVIGGLSRKSLSEL
jgi:hypothetical protein